MAIHGINAVIKILLGRTYGTNTRIRNVGHSEVYSWGQHFMGQCNAPIKMYESQCVILVWWCVLTPWEVSRSKVRSVPISFSRSDAIKNSVSQGVTLVSRCVLTPWDVSWSKDTFWPVSGGWTKYGSTRRCSPQNGAWESWESWERVRKFLTFSTLEQRFSKLRISQGTCQKHTHSFSSV